MAQYKCVWLAFLLAILVLLLQKRTCQKTCEKSCRDVCGGMCSGAGCTSWLQDGSQVFHIGFTVWTRVGVLQSCTDARYGNRRVAKLSYSYRGFTCSRSDMYLVFFVKFQLHFICLQFFARLVGQQEGIQCVKTFSFKTPWARYYLKYHVGTKSLSLSCDAQNKLDWRLKIRGNRLTQVYLESGC